MKPFKKILVPVDFSPHSEEAIRVAADVSQRYDATLTLLHVCEAVAYASTEGYILYTPLQVAEMMAEFGRRLDAARRDALAAGALRVETAQMEGNVTDEICRFADNQAFDLIVMGTHGRKGFQRILMGSNAVRVVRHSSCPVLTLRSPASESEQAAVEMP